MRYLSTVSVLPTVDGSKHVPSLEKQQWYRLEAKQCSAVDRGCSKTYLIHLKKKSQTGDVYTMFRIFSASFSL